MSDTTPKQVPIYTAFSAVQSKALKNLYRKYRVDRKQHEILTAIRYISVLRGVNQVSYTALSEILGHNHFSKEINKKRVQRLVVIGVLKESSRGKFWFLELTLTGIMVIEYYEELFLELLRKAEDKYKSRVMYGYLFPAPETHDPIIPTKLLTSWTKL